MCYYACDNLVILVPLHQYFIITAAVCTVADVHNAQSHFESKSIKKANPEKKTLLQ